MKKYIKFLLIIIPIYVFSGCNSAWIEPTSSCVENSGIAMNPAHPKANAFQAKMDEYISQGIPGATVLIADSSGVWYSSSGFADLESSISMEPCHINKLGSITKMMMGSLLWTFIQEGALSFSDPISKYIPDVADQITNGQDILVAMLVNHTSGIKDIATDLNYNLAVVNDFARSWTSEEILEFIADGTATNLPGEEVNYSNSNTMLLGMILDVVGGKPHSELLQDRIFTPLGMGNTFYYNYSSNFPATQLAQGYLDFNNNGGSIQNISDLNPGSGNGYTGVYSTVTDLYKFMKALMIDKTIIKDINLSLILGNMQLSANEGWRSSNGGIHDEYLKILSGNVQALGHAGGDIGYSANLNYFPHSQTIFAGSYNYGTNLPTELGDKLNQMREELILIAAE